MPKQQSNEDKKMSKPTMTCDFEFKIKIPVDVRIWNGDKLESAMQIMLDESIIRDRTSTKLYEDVEKWINANIMRNR